jgi:hypothetical protein
MLTETEVLGIATARLDALQIAYMLTGSYALACYTTPRMTRDLDLVVALAESDCDRLSELFSADFYVDEDAVRSAIASQRMFNLMHYDSGIKLDFIMRKESEYRQLEFSRRRQATIDGIPLWVVSREDLILSKLAWSRDSGSELQRRDAGALLNESVDRAYLEKWAAELGVADLLQEIAP